jgi:hypothetical protein
MRSRAVFAWTSVVLAAASPAPGEDWKPPPVFETREAFLAAYPKTEATAAALELEALAAAIGIDLAPKDDRRPHPGPADTEAYRKVALKAAEYLDASLESPADRLSAPDPALDAFLAQRAAAIAAVRSRLLRPEEIAWELDVSEGFDAGVPNFRGHVRLERLLGARALVEIRAGDSAAASQTLEAMWRLAEIDASRPGLFPLLIALADCRFIAGIARRLDAPAFEWIDRMRGRVFFEAFLAQIQNERWFSNQEEPKAREIRDATARIHGRVVEGLAEKTPCEWTRPGLRHLWEVAGAGEDPTHAFIAGMAADNLVDMLMRWHRYLLDSELTALVLEARAERAAARDHAWPAKLLDLESAVCPGAFWSYRRKRDGTAAFAFEGRAPEGQKAGPVVPLEFRAGIPIPTPTPTPTPTPVSRSLTPPNPANTLLPR